MSVPTEPAEGTPVLEVDRVGVTLAARRVLQDVTFTLDRGMFAGLIGANGAGKTTLLRLILGQLRADSGRISVLGRPRSPRERLIGYVPQRVQLDPDLPLRGRDLVSLGLDGHRWGVPLPSRGRQQAVEESLAAVEATSFAGARVGTLSGGEQQRVLLAQALVSRPRLLLLDEPLASLDLHSTREVVALLDRVSREQGVAVLLSAHDINPLLPFMDRVVYLAGGRAVSGTTNDVVRSDVLSELYAERVDVLHVHGRVVVVTSGGLPLRTDACEHEATAAGSEPVTGASR